ncbi:two-component system response regulator [Nitratiruptor sp. YY08-26]|uniref:response regulator transcription factor n=1 Tax=unclassified Nitratiruptor TaxID=2624044 RepID=UPI001916758D|nr:MULTISPECIES: response regulator transcription factor [unclassified Nitratiruptor]BCD61524.1 two-component system response regulator [Nitratiruptor sp. YY08-13]BCD65458.1 two-component system response regulator [Nitratiruptor sp. YY08-26]
MKRRILLLEDDQLLRETIVDFLEDRYTIIAVANGLEALEAHFNETFDLYLIDINVPQLNGIDFLQYLREKEDRVPAIFISSYNDLETIKKSFRVGADDYLKKPFAIEELDCRIEAVLRRYYAKSHTVEIGNRCQYDLFQRVLLCNGEAIYLPSKVMRLLELLIRNANRCTTNEEIIEALWHPSEEYSIGSIRIYLNTLRKYLGKESIKNVKGEGYILILNR